ncbi:MAG: thiolase domain-containing protein [Polyangiaceae bacterium]|nr:acetyl-CoA acetyltransferase [Myxococcales bacterium]MCB9590668.1 thiolase domain-containing protein [Polyangiaceae bacterium]
MSVHILGGYQSDFARNLARSEQGIDVLARECVEGALGDAGLEPADVQCIHVGNAFGELFLGQAQLGGLPATVLPGLWGVPAMRHEAACASGSMAVLGAMADIEAGRYEVALVLGIEQERNVPGDLATQHLGAAAYVGHEATECRYIWPHLFDRVAEEYERRHGLDHTHLAQIARKNFENARKNPLAQTRRWQLDERHFSDDDEVNPVVEGRLRRHDCSQLTDGAACVVLASEAFARSRRANAQQPQILGWGHRTAGLSLEQKLERSRESSHVFPHARQAALDALQRAGLGSVRELDGIETHDCFSITEYVAIDHFGITEPGQSYRAIESGELLLSGALPMNPSGGLMGLGHPVGATGVRMLWDAARQVVGRAGDNQVEGATRFATFNIGGSCTTVASFVVGI